MVHGDGVDTPFIDVAAVPLRIDVTRGVFVPQLGLLGGPPTEDESFADSRHQPNAGLAAAFVLSFGAAILVAVRKRRSNKKRLCCRGRLRASRSQDRIALMFEPQRRYSVLALGAAVGMPGTLQLAAAIGGPRAEAEALLAQTEVALAAGNAARAYALTARGLRLMTAASDVATVEDPVAALLHVRHTEALLMAGFAREALADSTQLGATAAVSTKAASWVSQCCALLRGRALLQLSEYTEALVLFQQVLRFEEREGEQQVPALPAYASTPLFRAEPARLQELMTQATLGAKHRRGEIDFARLVELVAAGDAPRTSSSSSSSADESSTARQLPQEEGPLRFESEKVVRQEIGNGRGRGVVAVQDLAAGEAFIFTRPLGLVLPNGAGGGATAQPLSEQTARGLLAKQLESRARRDAQFAQELFSLYDGTNEYIPSWTPGPWSPDKESLPVLSPATRGRIDQIIRYNSHRCPGGQDARTGMSQPGLGLWLWPPMVNHAVEADGAPNCAHIFIGDAMLFRTTRPVWAGEELLDRYTSPLAPRFEQTLENLADHDMKDPVYEACAKDWTNAEMGAPLGNGLLEGQAMLALLVKQLEGVRNRTGSLLLVSEEEFRALKGAYAQAAAETRKGSSRLLLVPTEVRALELLCPLAAIWAGRADALEMRAELARRVQAARPFHFSAVGLWVEFYARLSLLPPASLDSLEIVLAREADARVREMAEFWLHGLGHDWQHPAPISNEQLQRVFLPWVLQIYGFSFGWFSQVLGPRLGHLPTGAKALRAILASGSMTAAVL